MEIRFHLQGFKRSHTDRHLKGACAESLVEHGDRAVGIFKEKEEVPETRGEGVLRAPHTRDKRDKRLENTESRENMSDGVSDDESFPYRNIVPTRPHDEANTG